MLRYLGRASSDKTGGMVSLQGFWFGVSLGSPVSKLASEELGYFGLVFCNHAFRNALS